MSATLNHSPATDAAGAHWLRRLVRHWQLKKQAKCEHVAWIYDVTDEEDPRFLVQECRGCGAFRLGIWRRDCGGGWEVLLKRWQHDFPSLPNDQEKPQRTAD